MVSSDVFNKMSDREVVQKIKETGDQENIKALKKVLYSRYEKFVHKHWHKLYRQMNASAYLSQIKDDFYSDSYLSFSNALDAINTEKILNDKWKFLGYYGFYLSNQRKSYAKKVLKKYRTETALEIPGEEGEAPIYLSDLAEEGRSPSAEDTFIEQDFKERFWNAIRTCKTSEWNETQVKLFDLRAKGTPVKKICEELKISPWKYNKLLEGMRAQLESKLDGFN